jgi:5-methylcytosine-specific restriction endonuclease McrA
VCIVGWDGRCAYCQQDCPKPTLDHIIPLSLGGSHRPENLAPCCMSCNSQKNAKRLQDWRPDLSEFVTRRAADIALVIAAPSCRQER